MMLETVKGWGICKYQRIDILPQRATSVYGGDDRYSAREKMPAEKFFP